MNFQDSITEQTMGRVKKTWAEDLSEAEPVPEKIFDFLNEPENLCTAEFILRRQIQTQQPKIFLRAVAEAKLTVADFADLRKSGNVLWPAELVEKLSGILASTKFEGVRDLGLDKRQWKKILTGEAFCNRASAVKLIFALDMDDTAAAKFLIADGKPTFSTRNPFDYLCAFCRKGKFTYDAAVAMLEKFESRRKKSDDDSGDEEPLEFATLQLENETERILSCDKLSPTDKQEQIVDYMLEHQGEFVTKVERKSRRAEYPSGFSKQNNLKLKIFLRYLTELYPSFLQWKEVNEFDSYLISRMVQKNSDGAPNPNQLWQAMTEAQEIFFCETEELEEIGLPTGNELDANGKRMLKEKQRYDTIPFNREILLPLKNLSKTLRENLRAEEFPDNAAEVDRSTILFLTYFFICGCLMRGGLDDLAAKLDEEISSEENPQKNNLLYALKTVVGNVESLTDEENPLELYVDSLNEMLNSFRCENFYAPFVIDRFILFCLLTFRRPASEEDLPRYLMNALIEESYRLSKKILEGEKHGG